MVEIVGAIIERRSGAFDPASFQTIGLLHGLSL
jgi:hypothetical protein